MTKESLAIYFAGLIQGIALVAFPAASTIFTNPHEFNFSNTAYGGLFIPEAFLSILASALNPSLSRHLGSKSVFMLGLMANLLSMLLFVASAAVMKNQSLAYAVLLIATSFLGIGFGLTVPTLNSMAALLNPQKIDGVLLVVNALLGTGTALAPVFISLFVTMGYWWGLPILLSILLVAVMLFSLPLPLPGGKIDISMSAAAISIPIRFWLFAAFAVLYGIIETLNGNWVSIYMQRHFLASIQMQSMALTAFWAMVTVGRIFFAAASKFVREEVVFQISPFISAAAFAMTAALPRGEAHWGIVAFGLNGLGCAALLPLTISFGSKQLEQIVTSVPGMVIAFYLIGYGIAAFGVGPLKDDLHVHLQTIYAFAVILAVLLGILSLVIIQTKKSNQGRTL